ncbi:SpoIVB peptidase [Anaerofustis stercorihominis]|uniref:SpoIVB peptidase n=1 Tax=Anaerofustis stercorihominis TaxID=214853 RepID=UPI0021087443|nr:SpoIVB peptidase [Anaerofustis stercorihominis]
MNAVKKKRVLLGFLSLILIISAYILYLNFSTKEITVLSSQTTSVSLNLPKNCSIQNENEDLKVNGKSEKNYNVDNDKIDVYSSSAGKYKLKAKLFGIVPINNYNINVYPNVKLHPSGNLVGVSMNTKGAIAVQFQSIIDVNDNEVCPAKDAGIKMGDIIVKINDKKVYNAKEVISELNKLSHKELSMVIKRENTEENIKITPVKAKKDNKYKIGVWVRDSVAGIGTLTCYNEDKSRFVALGHSINDVDTGIIMPVKNGNVIESELISIVKGKRNAPGELRGVLKAEKKDIIGSIHLNNDYGLYGDVTKKVTTSNALDIALQDKIKEGKAQILTTIDNNGPRLFDIKIKKTYKQTKKNTKSMLIEVTDKELLSKTGGIVQGMSGSPIIQDGKLIGAVTHVFISDPTKGYGIYIEWLLEDLLAKQN